MLLDFKTLANKYNINPNCVIHLGANEGQEAESYRDAGIHNVIWVEAIPEVFKKLQLHLEKTNCMSGAICFNACVSDKDGEEVEFKISNNGAQSSSMFDFGTHEVIHPTVKFIDKIKLKTHRVDTLLSNMNIDGDILLNADLQGAELLALKGMGKWLNKVKWCYLEINKRETYVGAALIDEVDGYLKDFGFDRVETAPWVGGSWSDALFVKQEQVTGSKIQYVPTKFRMPDKMEYPDFNTPDFEYFFSKNVDSGQIPDGWTYLPILVTAYHKRHNFGNDKQALKDLQDFIDSLDNSKKYFLPVQYDDGILVDISKKNIKVFSMSGLPMDYCLPLICQKAPFEFNSERTIFCSFIGRKTHPIRDKVFELKLGERYYITDQRHPPKLYYEILSKSIFTLAMRGYGPTSFRLQQAIEMGSIPVYISDTHLLPHDTDFDYGVIIEEKDIDKLDEILSGMSAKEVERKQKMLPQVFKEQFTFEANKDIILSKLKPFEVEVKNKKWNVSTTKFTEEELKTDERPVCLFAGIFSPMYDSYFMVKGFEEAGYQCEPFNWQKSRFQEGLQGMLDRLLTKARSLKPELIFLHIQNPDIITPEIAKELSEYGFVVNYTFDVRNSIDWYKQIAPNIGLTLFGDKESVTECHNEGIMNVGYMASSADYNTYRKLDVRERTDEFGEIVFLGNNTVGSALKFPKAEERVEMVEFMKKNFWGRFKIYGLNWGIDSQIAYPHLETLVYNSAKVAITHNNFFRSGYSSDRIFRSMGSSCYTISQYYPEINKDFNNKVCASWLTFEMLATEVDKALSNDARRKMIADEGYNFVREKHTWKNRVEQLKTIIHGLAK